MASVGGLPLAEFFGHLPPRRACPRHPQDAAEHGPVVVGRSADRSPLRRQQRANLRPLLVSEPRLFERDRGDLGRACPLESTPSGAFGGPATSCHGLVRPPPRRPSQEEASSSLRLGHRQYQLPRLRHGRRDQAGAEIPLLPPLPASSSRAARCTTTRKAWASRQRVMCRCQAPHLLTS